MPDPAPQIPIAVVLPPHEGFSPSAVGAVGLAVHRLSAAARDRFQPTVIGAPSGTPVFADVAFRPARPGLLPARGARRYAAGVAAVLRGLRPALIEVHNRPEVALALAGRFPSVPVSLFLHNDPQGMRKARRPAERTHLLARLARIVTVSDWLRRRLMEGVTTPTRPPVVLHHGLDPGSLPHPRPATAREKLILFAGRIVADKGADSFVAACAAALPRLPGWRAQMIGADRFRAASPETGFIRSLRPMAERAGIHMAGYRPHAEVLASMACAAIVVVPSRWPEPFGLTALEAMVCGAALLCSGRGGLAEVTGDAAVPIDPDDPVALAETLVAVASDPEHRAALSASGLARARRFDLHDTVRALDVLREEILASCHHA